MKASMFATNGGTVGIATLFICFAVVTTAWSQSKETQILEKQFGPIQDIVDDPLATTRDYEEAKVGLVKLLTETEAVINKYRVEEGSELSGLHGKMVAAIATIRGRLPNPPSNDNRTGFPVPEFESDTQVGKAATALRAAQTALAQQLLSTPADEKATNKLIESMILAQEALAWEAGWPFDDREATGYKRAGKLTIDIYHTRRNRGIANVNSQLATDASQVGRKTPRLFVIHAPENKSLLLNVSKTISELRDDLGEAVMKGTVVFSTREQDALLGRGLTSRSLVSRETGKTNLPEKKPNKKKKKRKKKNRRQD